MRNSQDPQKFALFPEGDFGARDRGRAAALHVVDESATCLQGGAGMSEQDRAGSHPDSHPTLCLQRPPRRLAELIQTGADQQDAPVVTLNRACCYTPLTRCRGQHSGGGALAPSWDDDRHNKTCARCCSWWWCSTGDVHVFRIATIPYREGYGPGRSAHTVRLRSVPLLSAANDSETHPRARDG